MTKKFVLTVTEDSDGGFLIETENAGFNALELLGILTSKQHDIFEQYEHPTKFVLKAIYPDGTEEIVDEVNLDKEKEQ